MSQKIHTCGFTLLLLGALILNGCSTRERSTPTADELPVGTRISLPANARALGDIDCEFYKAGGKQDLEQFEIRCPGWERPAGLVWRGNPPRRSANWQQTFVTDSDLADDIVTEAECGKPESAQILGDQTAVLRRCISHNGGFPYLLIVAEIDQRAFVLWGPAHLAPLFEGFILSSQQGAQATLPGSQSQLIALAEQAIAIDGHQIGLEDMGQFTALDELSTLYNSAKNHQRALEVAQRALEIHERIKGADDADGGYLVGRIARELSRQQPSAADAMFERGEPLVRNASNPADLPEFLVYRAWHELSQGNREQAEQDAQTSWKLSQGMAGQSRRGTMNPRIGHSLIGVGDIQMELGQLNEAESAYTQALRIFDTVRGGDYHWVGKTHERLAEVHRRRREFGPARSQAQAAIELNRSLFGEGRILAESLMLLATIETEAGQSQQALDLWRQAKEMLLNDRATLAQLRPEDFDGYLTLLFALADSADTTQRNALLDEAFIVSQLGQRPAAGSAVTQMAARLAEKDPAVRDAVRQLQDTLKARQDAQYALGLEQSKPFQERSSAQEEVLKTQLRTASEQYQQQEERLLAQFPRYGRLVTPTPLNAAAVAKLLRRHEALLRILPGNDASWVFLVKADGSLQAITATLSAQQLTAQVERLRIGVDGRSGQLPDFDLTLAHQLYQQLLGPLDPALSDIKHLIVVPAGALLSLPPALLVRQPPPAPHDYQAAAWLIRDMALSLLPSVVALEQFRQLAGASQARQSFIGFGDPSFSIAHDAPTDEESTATGQACRITTADISRLAPLPETANELRSLAKTLGATSSRVVLGRQATVSSVEASSLAHYRIVAFATHALLAGELDCLSEPALALTPQTGAKTGDNGLLSASAIAELKLDAEWVLLSACNTAGAGNSLGGEGLSGLATAFFYAGSRALLASHWSVVSKPTVFLTTHTFEAFRKTPANGRAEALRQAQLALIEQPNWAHPIFWAAFTLIGESSPSP